ncbi:MAG TPA: carboxyl transferase domain-containing protein [Myxococcota bacterium]
MTVRSQPIRRLAIVNRGEAAMRCIRAVKSLRAQEGCEIEAVALYTEIDRDAPFVRHADLAVAMPAPRGEVAAYLDYDGLMTALRKAGADAVWPGWGFVAEHPAFVERLERAGIRFLGPSPSAMHALGDKIGSKHLAEEVGVPVTAWSKGVVENEEDAERWALEIGLPVVIKASAGGGGRGIRVVESAPQVAAAFRSASSEAKSAFGDGRLFIEQKVTGGRHIEVQIAGDSHGNVLAVGCRDCSVQRRHQKVLEEAPPPNLAREVRDALEAAAVQVAKRVGYVGVGTVEFLVSGDHYFFLEMNPRLQVEHGITEELTGLDLVQIQIRIARGESLAGVKLREYGWAIEARVCAEDPDQGFLPAPGRIARFDPALGPRIRVDTGYVQGSTVPAAFDSLIAKVIATGADREEARARLASALDDFDLVIEGGATNKGWLSEILDCADYRKGAVDTTWLDRFALTRERDDSLAAPALVAAGILAYQAARARARLNFYREGAFAADRVPVASGQQIDLGFGGEQYRLDVFAIGAWRYRVHLDGAALTATLREEGEHTARLQLGERIYRVAYDIAEANLRVELEGRAFRFGSQSAGQVRAAAPAMVVAVHVQPGDAVTAGQPIGLLEAMKMEVAFEAPVSGVVTEVLVRKGTKVSAGDVLLVIEPRSDEASLEIAPVSSRLALPDLPDPLVPLFRAQGEDRLGAPDLAQAAGASPTQRGEALTAVRDEARRALLGYDVNPARAEKLAEFLEAALPDDLPEAFYADLSQVRHELALVADVARLFIRSPAASVSGEIGPSNDARMRMFARRVRAGGAGIGEEFLALVRAALAHYDIASLDPSDALERAVLRLLASQQRGELRDRLTLAMLRRAASLARHGVPLAEDSTLARALDLLAGMRGLLSNSVADAAIEARYVIFERPDIERLAERSSKQVQAYLDAAEAEPTAPPADVLLDLAGVQRAVFDRVGAWIADADPRRRAIALAAQLQRAYAPEEAIAQLSFRESGRWIERMDFPGGRVVLGATASLADLAETLRLVVRAAEATRESHDWPAVHALELFAAIGDDEEPPNVAARVAPVLEGTLAAGRVTITLVRAGGPDLHFTFVPTPGGFQEDAGLHGMHPEAARRVDLKRLAEFTLERLPASEGLYAFWGKSNEDKSDERMFVLGDLRSRSPDPGREAALHVPAFEHMFFEATRALRNHLALRDPQRRLQWNRIAIYLAPEIALEASLADRLSRKLAPATRNLGLEKVIVRLNTLDRANLAAPSVPRELVISNITGSNLTLEIREPRRDPLRTASHYERKVVEARRRRLVYPYEIVRMLTGSHGDAAGDVELPVGSFEEWDLDANGHAMPVARPYGRNSCAVAFGIVTTPTEKVPEGMARVIVLSDPTLGMGALGPEECDRIAAAIDLAEQRKLPVEWIPVSSGARIAMDSGTENLDATARVVRRIIEFTQAGGAIHVIVAGVNVGAQSYFDSLATMLMHTRGALIMTPGGSMVLTGRAALEASGAVSAEDEGAIGGFERIMGPNGEAQYYAADIRDAYRILFEHYRFTYVVPGEKSPRAQPTRDPDARDAGAMPIAGGDFARVGEIFDDATNPGRKRPFSMRPIMSAVVDQDGSHLERWRAWVGAETAIVWDAHLGGQPVCLIGIESQSVTREGYRPPDGPSTWTGGTLFPLSSKKVARALNAASGNRPAVILANLSGFDGSPESMRKMQLEWGAEIARAVVNFDGPILFLVVSRYHGGAYVVFSRSLNPRLRAAALEGSFASVIGGGPAAVVVFSRDVRARAAADPRVRAAQPGRNANEEARARFEKVLEDVRLEKQAELAEEFDKMHSVQRAKDVGSLEAIVPAREMRAFLIGLLREEAGK